MKLIVKAFFSIPKNGDMNQPHLDIARLFTQHWAVSTEPRLNCLSTKKKSARQNYGKQAKALHILEEHISLVALFHFPFFVCIEFPSRVILVWLLINRIVNW